MSVAPVKRPSQARHEYDRLIAAAKAIPAATTSWCIHATKARCVASLTPPNPASLSQPCRALGEDQGCRAQTRY